MSEASAAISQKHLERGWRLAYALLGNASDADDVLQDALLVLHRKGKRGGKGIWTYLSKAITFEARNLRRKNARRGAKVAQAEPEVLEASARSPEDDPLEHSLKQEFKGELWRAFRSLPTEEREALSLTLLAGMNQRDAAKAAGVSQATLSRRSAEGLDMLRRELGIHKEAIAPVLVALPASFPLPPDLSVFAAVSGGAGKLIAGGLVVKKVTTTIAALLILALMLWGGLALWGELDGDGPGANEALSGDIVGDVDSGEGAAGNSAALDNRSGSEVNATDTIGSNHSGTGSAATNAGEGSDDSAASGTEPGDDGGHDASSESADAIVVEGVVVDEAGEPIQGAEVFTRGRHTRTDAAGKFNLTLLKGQEARTLRRDAMSALFKHPDYKERLNQLFEEQVRELYSDAIRELDQPAGFVVLKQGYSEFTGRYAAESIPTRIVLKTSTKIFGQIANAPSDCSVYLVPWDALNQRPLMQHDERQCLLGASGGYEFVDPVFEKEVDAEYVVVVSDSVAGRLLSAPILMQQGRNERVDLSYSDLGALRVRVLPPAGHELAGIPVLIVPSLSSSFTEFSTLTDEQGMATFKGLQPGDFRVRLGYSVRTSYEEYRGTYYISPMHPITIQGKGDRQDLLIDFSQSTTVKMRVTINGAPPSTGILYLPDARKDGSFWSGMPEAVNLYFGSKGELNLYGISPASYNVTFHDNYVNGQQTSYQDKLVVESAPGEVDFVRDYRDKIIKGRVERPDNLAKGDMRRGRVYFWIPGEYESRFAEINEAGEFAIRTNNEGEHQLFASLPGYASPVTKGTPGAEEVVLPLQSAFPVDLAIRKPDNVGENSFYLQFEVTGGSLPKAGINLEPSTVNADGWRWKPLLWLPAGSYNLQLFDWFNPVMLKIDKSLEVKPEAGGTIWIEAVASAALHVYVEGHEDMKSLKFDYLFRDETGVEKKLGQMAFSQTSAGLLKAYWNIRRLPEGKYTFILREPGKKPVEREVTLSSKEPVKLFLKLEDAE